MFRRVENYLNIKDVNFWDVWNEVFGRMVIIVVYVIYGFFKN